MPSFSLLIDATYQDEIVIDAESEEKAKEILNSPGFSYDHPSVLYFDHLAEPRIELTSIIELDDG